MPKGIPKSGENKGWFKKGSGFWTGKKRLDMLGNNWNVGKTPWNKGITGYTLKRNNFEWPKEEKSYHWKGDNVGYQGVHAWIVRHLGKAKECSICRENRPRYVHWANISHEYKRDTTDFVQLCAKHHKAYDMGRLDL